MTTDAVTLFFALLAVVAQASVLLLAGLEAVGLLVPAAAEVREAVIQTVAPDALRLAAAVAAVCTAGSLYLSEVAHFVPCRLCWYQRAAMYPLVPLLGLAARRGWQRVDRVALPLAVGGASISAWHVVVERFPSLEAGACDPSNPCSLIWVERFGYLTIPTMALSGFVLIAALLLVHRHVTVEEAP